MKALQGRKTLLTAVAIIAFAASVARAAASEPVAPELKIDIAAQLVGDALNEFARQSGLQVVIDPKEGGGIRASGVTGRFTPQAALAQLLAGTGLRYEFLNERTVAVRSAQKMLRSISGEDTAQSLLQRAPQATIAMQSVDEAARARTARLRQAEQASAATAGSSAAEDTAARDSRGIPEILVKGQRSINTDIRRTEDDPQPYVVYGSEEIQRSQAATIEDFLRQRLPMNTTSTARRQLGGIFSSDTTSRINLRGLGTNQTLILVNGRRIAAIGDGGFPGQPDLNGIPLSSVERIEVLPSTAGGIYGGNATGGVINVILRRDYQGLEAKATYINTFDSDTGSLQLDLSAGFNIGRTQLMISASRSTANDLTLGDRDFSQRALALTQRNNPAAIAALFYPPAGRLVNINTNQGNLTLDEEYGGTDLGYSFMHLPAGYAGIGVDGIAPLIAGAGSYDLRMPEGLAGTEAGLLGTPEVESASINIRHEFSSRVEAFVDVSRLGNNGRTLSAGVPNLVWDIPADASNNPFQQTVSVNFPTSGFSYADRSEATTVQATGGVIVRLPGNWVGEVGYGWSRARRFQRSASSLVGLGFREDTFVAGSLQLFRDTNEFPLDFTPYLLPVPGYVQGPYDNTLKSSTLRLSGPAMMLPGGPLNLSILAERRDEVLGDAYVGGVDEVTGTFFRYFYPYKSQGADSLYVEARAPLIAAAQNLPGAKTLELQLSVRRDDYVTRSSNVSLANITTNPPPSLTYTAAKLASTNYTAGLRYMPLEDVTLRASFGTGFLPPSVNQITPRPLTISFALGGLTDPKRGNTNPYVGLPWTLILGGNPGLEPESSESWSAGVIFTPRFAPGLRLSVDYTRIDKTDEISNLSYQYILDSEDSLRGRIVRGENLPGDPAGWAGRIVSLDNTLINAARTWLEAYDFQLDYAMQAGRWGSLNWYALATYQPEYRMQRSVVDPVTRKVGFSDGPLKWRGNLGLDWTLGLWRLSWNMQHYHSYLVYSSTDGQGFADQLALNQGSRSIPSQSYHDLIGSYHFGGGSGFMAGLLADTEISIGLQNVLNTSPPIVASTSTTASGYSTHGDPRLRRYSLSIRKNF